MSDDTTKGGDGDDTPEVYEELPPDCNVVQLIPKETAEETIARLAALPNLEYEKVRQFEADELGIRVSVLDEEAKRARPHHDQENDLGLFEPEPWPEEVDGDDLLDQTRQAILRHVVMSQAQAAVVALWAVHTHTFDCWRHTPRLGITAPEKGCGKSTVLDVLEHLTPRAIKTENLSTATMFRVVDGYRPTLLIDEFDTFLPGNEDLRGCLNAGHARGGRHLRCDGEDNQVRAFKTFAPAAIAGIGNLPPTLADRSIPILLHKRKVDEPLEELTEHHITHLRELASQAARWVADSLQTLVTTKPELPAGMINRAADNVRPLLAIAEVAGGDWPDLAREAVAAAIAGAGDEAESIGVQLLADIRSIFTEEKLPTKLLLERLHGLDGRPWAEYGRKEQPISASQLARLLRWYGITPGTQREGGDTFKGYQLDVFIDVFSRYLPSHRHNPQKTAENSQFQAVTNSNGVTAQKTPKPAPSSDCDGVTARTPPTAGNTELSDDQRAHLATLEDDLDERAALQDDGMDIPDFLNRANVTE